MAFGIRTDCLRSQELISRAGDSALPAADTAWLHEHLAACPACAREARADEELRGLLRGDPLPVTELRLPSGEQIARSIVEAEAAPRRLRRPVVLGWSGAALATATAILLIVARPTPHHSEVEPVPTPAAAQPATGFWIEDDERTGRDVIVAPAGTLSGGA
jgi:anti-sigma factor RsiW